MIEAMTKAVSVMTMQDCPETSKGMQYQCASNYIGREQQPQLAHGADGRLQPGLTCFYCKDIRHIMNNCVWLNNKIAQELQAQEHVTTKKAKTKLSTRPNIPKKIMAPQTLDQSEGEKVCGPDQSDKIKPDKRIVGLMEKISSQQVSAQIKIEVVQRAVAICPKVNMGCGRKRIPSLLDSGSQVTLKGRPLSFLCTNILALPQGLWLG